MPGKVNNNERAEKLAGIFGWEIGSIAGEPAVRVPFGAPPEAGPMNLWIMMEDLFIDTSCLLPWLLDELPKRGCRVDLRCEPGMCKALVTTKVVERTAYNPTGLSAASYKAESRNADVLLALCDAVIAAHADGGSP